jgi:FkbM family methyltransferase
MGAGPSFFSYAQRLEDYHLDLVVGDRAEGFYVDVGGGHPLGDNVSYHFYLKGWRGLVVEPQEGLAALHRRVRPRDIVVDHLVGRTDGEVPFHLVEGLHGFSSMVEGNAKGAAAFGAGYATVTKRVRPLSALLDEAGVPRVDFLKVDVEGAEADVLAGVDFRRHRPSVLCVEAVTPGAMAPAHEAFEAIVVAADYRFAFEDGLNRFYVAAEEASLAARFPKEPAAWDSVSHYYDLGPVQKRADHPDAALADRLIRGFLAEVPFLSEADILRLLARSAGPPGMETGAALRALLVGRLPGRDGQGADGLLDDRVRAALARVAAFHDGGMSE